MKSKREYYTPVEFAKLFHIDKQTLIYYDNQGIFSPAYKSEKGYRYYSTKQILPFAELLSLRALHLPGTLLAEFNGMPHRNKLLELLSDKIMEYEESIAAMEKSIVHLRQKIKVLEEIRTLPTDQVMIIPHGTRYAQKSPLFPAGTTLRDACLRSAPLITLYGSHLFERNLKLAFMPDVEDLSELCGDLPFHLVLLSDSDAYMENPITYPPSLYLTYIFSHNLAPLSPAVAEHLQEQISLLGLTVTSPIFFNQLLTEDGTPSRCRLEIAVAPAKH